MPKKMKERPLREEEKKIIEEAIKKTVREYGEVLRKLGRDSKGNSEILKDKSG